MCHSFLEFRKVQRNSSTAQVKLRKYTFRRKITNRVFHVKMGNNLSLSLEIYTGRIAFFRESFELN